MNQVRDAGTPDETPIGDLFRPLVLYRRQILRAVFYSVALAAVLGAFYYLLQPVTRTAYVGFRPLFEGADKGKYPNALPFSPTDIIDASIVDQVITSNNLGTYCGIDAMRSALVVREASPALQFLDIEFQARLSDARLTGVERQRLQDEYTSRRSALPIQYEISFVQPRDCKRVPDEVVFKTLGDVLETWAKDSQQKRGVLKIQVGVITDRIFDQASASDEPLLVRADLIRSAMVRVLSNIDEVEKMPGASLIRVGESRVSLAEVRPRIEDLMLARLDPLIGAAGRSLGAESKQWVQLALQTATAQHAAAEKVAETYRQALREYSGMTTLPTTPQPARDSTPQRSGDVQALTPQIDRSFIESIVAMSAANTTFRQEITRRGIDASTEAVRKGSALEHYRALFTAMQSNGTTVPADQVAAKLEKIIAEAKEQTRLFNQIYDEFSRVSFRAGSAMYRVERPAVAVALKGFAVRDLVTMTLGALLISPVLFALFYLGLHHMRRFLRGMR